MSFNPFFIRASVYWFLRPHLLPRRRFCRFNPFFIRASVYWRTFLLLCKRSVHRVSIPSSSGHQFTDILNAYDEVYQSLRFQSLLHQGISLLSSAGRPHGLSGLPGFNPFFIRASVYCLTRASSTALILTPFQSLLHQGISLLEIWITDKWRATVDVSIPSSSGHQFTVRFSGFTT